MGDFSKAAHIVNQLIDRVEAEVWDRCIPGAKSSWDRLQYIEGNSGQFLHNLEAFLEYHLLDRIGEFRPGRADDNEELADLVLADLEARRSSPLVGGLREWAMFCLSYRLCELTGKELPTRSNRCQPFNEDDKVSASEVVAGEKKRKLRLRKGWTAKK